MKHQHPLLVAGIVVVLVSAAASSAGAQSARTDEAVLGQFATSVQAYVALQRNLRAEAPALVAGSDPETINDASDVLAVAIQRARPRARQGDFFTPEVRAALQHRIARSLASVDYPALVGANDPEERSAVGAMRTYVRLPTDGPLATMPTSVLEALPPLPDELEFRFVGENLVLRDRQACLVLDYMRIRIPRR
jgi:hypothetical protein